MPFDFNNIVHSAENQTADPNGDMLIADGVLKAYRGTCADVIVPEGVVEISQNAFKCKNIRSVFLPDSVEIIRDSAFKDCHSLERINIPLKLRFLGSQVFFGCEGLQIAGTHKSCNIILDEKMRSIPRRLFLNCKSLKQVELPEGIEQIGEEAFWNCEALDSVVIPKRVATICDRAFQWCKNLKNICFCSDETVLEGNVFKDCYSLADKNGFVIVRNVLYSFCGEQTIVSIPLGVKEIAPGAFSYTGIESRTYNITEIIVPESVEIIGDWAFSHCEHLRKITLPGSIKTLGKDIVYDCKLLDEVNLMDYAPVQLKELAVSVAEKAHVRRKKEEEYQLREQVKAKREAARVVIRDKSMLEYNIRSFVKKHGGDSDSSQKAARYIYSKLDIKVFMWGNWYIFDNKIEYLCEWGGHSFFDDGGGIKGINRWSIAFLGNSSHTTENERLEKTTPYPCNGYIHYEETFVCRDPFGMKGLFEFNYLYSEEETD